MTEQEWIESGDPCAMLKHLSARHKVSTTTTGKRKLRLFACGCIRQLWDLLTAAPMREAVVICERFADGLVTGAELTATASRVSALEPSRRRKVAEMLVVAFEYATWQRLSVVAVNHVIVQCCSARCHALAKFRDGIPHDSKEWVAASRAQADLLRDLFGNPFRPVAVDPTWLTASVLGLSQEVYEKRAFDLLPVLGDALEDAGCGEPAILDHLRGGGEHARGCWVVDALTGRG